jgi:hypothetical protein
LLTGGFLISRTEGPENSQDFELLVLVLFLVKVEQGPPVCLAQPPAQFLVGLAAACALLSLSAPDQIEMPPEELLPWTGNV